MSAKDIQARTQRIEQRFSICRRFLLDSGYNHTVADADSSNSHGPLLDIHVFKNGPYYFYFQVMHDRLLWWHEAPDQAVKKVGGNHFSLRNDLRNLNQEPVVQSSLANASLYESKTPQDA